MSNNKVTPERVEDKRMNYFGTNLSSPGHYFWDLESDQMRRSNIIYGSLPFDPEYMPRRAKGELIKKGDAKFYVEGGYSILAIEGSPADDRWGTRSVFFVKEELSKEQMIEKINAMPIAKKIIESMPFETQVKPQPNEQ